MDIFFAEFALLTLVSLLLGLDEVAQAPRVEHVVVLELLRCRLALDFVAAPYAVENVVVAIRLQERHWLLQVIVAKRAFQRLFVESNTDLAHWWYASIHVPKVALLGLLSAVGHFFLFGLVSEHLLDQVFNAFEAQVFLAANQELKNFFERNELVLDNRQAKFIDLSADVLLAVGFAVDGRVEPDLEQDVQVALPDVGFPEALLGWLRYDFSYFWLGLVQHLQVRRKLLSPHFL